MIALVVTPEGLPLAYEVLPGNTTDCKTLRLFGDNITQQYGRARRVWARLAKVPDRKSTRLNSSHIQKSRMPSSA